MVKIKTRCDLLKRWKHKMKKETIKEQQNWHTQKNIHIIKL